jgi:hypothetical protein
MSFPRGVNWFFGTRTFHAMHGEPGGSAGVDETFASNWGPGVGAEIMGRNKFGPQPKRWRPPARPRAASMSASAAARPPSASSWPPA